MGVGAVTMHPGPLVLPDLEALARAEGLTGSRAGWGPCPVCGAVRRGGSDGRPPLTFYRGRAGGELRWSCHAGGCGAGGGALALLAARRYGEVPPKGDPRWADLFAELRAGTTAPRPAERAPRPESGARNANENPGVEAPPPEEVAALWAACRPVNGPGCAAIAGDWLREVRGLDPEALAVLDLARVLPDVYPWPRWIPWLGMDRAAWLALYRLAAPMYDAAGELRALRFRAVNKVRELNPDADPPRLRWRALPVQKKALAGRGTRLAGLVLADPWGLALLRGGRDVDGVPWDGAVLVAEGEIDLWAATSSGGRFRDGATFAAFAVVAGSWTPEVAARIPDGARVTIATDADEPGDKYAEAVRASLAGRCKVRRMARTETWGNNAER